MLRCKNRSATWLYLWMSSAVLVTVTNESIHDDCPANAPFRCENGHCISHEYECNDNNDCGDWSDETHCHPIEHGNCDPGEFECGDHNCIPGLWVCNGASDCLDNSDEISCPGHTCRNDEFKCGDNYCISKEWVCNGHPDCRDNSDETNCPECDATEFQCRNKACIKKSWRCDGPRDCKDGSDEENCPRRNVSMEMCTINNRMFKCKDNKGCLELFEVCNNHTDCQDKSDEGGQCSNVGMCQPSNCTGQNEDCFRSPDGPICGCLHGYEMKNGQCKDIDECQIYGTCDQKCSNNPGTFSCFCDPKYVLQTDGHTCKAEGGEALLVYATQKQVRAYYLVSGNSWPVSSKQSMLVGVAYDGNHVYWSGNIKKKESIVRASEDGSHIETLVDSGLGVLEDLAIDWVTKNIYFTDSEFKRIGVCDHDASVCAVLHDDEDRPRGIALHPEVGVMYWSDWGDHPRISRSGMDGSMEFEFVNDSLHWPNGIVIDYANERLYWVDAKLHTIESIKLDGTDRRRVLEDTNIRPFAIDIFEDSIYWSDWKGKSIEACNKFTGKERRVIITDNYDRINGIHVFHPATENSDIDNPCKDGQCSDLCVLSPKSVNPAGYKCLCPEDKVLKSNRHSCVPSDKMDSLVLASSEGIFRINHNQLGRQNLTEIGTGHYIGKLGSITYDPIADSLIMSDSMHHEIISFNLKTSRLSNVITVDIGNVEGLAVDYYAHNLYFADSENGKLKVLSLDKGHCKTLLNRLVDIPKDVAVVPEEGVFFISLFNPDGDSHIDRFSLTGNLQSRTHIIEDKLAGPFLPVHYSHITHRLFFGGAFIIENIDVDEATHRQQFWLAPHSVSLTSIGYDIFWTDSDPEMVYYVDMNKDKDKESFIDLGDLELSDPFELTVISNQHHNVSHPCLTDNGNCNFLCLSNKQNKVCACPDGMILKGDGLGCAPAQRCATTDFTCSLSSVEGLSRHCVPFSNQCDGHKDCPNGEDEDNCNGRYCTHGQFACHDNSKCINRDKMCDNIIDCDDHSDELDCGFVESCDDDDHFKCASGNKCIDIIARCDYHVDCDDRSDEEGCKNVTCNAETHFQCTSGKCIPISWRCNTEKDCSDGSDEDATTCDPWKTCNPNQFTCDSGQCIDTVLKCDGGKDCEDESDEVGCKSVIEPVIYVDDNSTDDEPRSCDMHREFVCNLAAGQCVPKTARCNGTEECPGGEDEDGCRVCTESDFKCGNGICIPKQWICDKVNDCGDSSDEDPYECSTVVTPHNTTETCNGFLCTNKVCILAQNVCNGVDDCGDRSDEGGRCGYGCVNAGCSDHCTEMPSGPKCRCPEGYTLMGDGKTCTDINECLAGQKCSQFCKNTDGGFECWCKYPEYSLREDRKSCKAKGGEMQYLFAYKNQIRTMWGPQANVGIVYLDKKINFRLSGLTADVHRKYVYWSSERSGAVFRTNVDNRNVVQNVTARKPSMISVDWITGNVYVVEEDNKIVACNFDVKTCVPIYSTERVMRIGALKVDPLSRYMFWSETSIVNPPFSKIYRSDMSGSGVTVIVKGELETIADIFVDSIHNSIFWAESTKNHIEKVKFDGTNRRYLFNVHYNPIDLAIFEDYAYFLVEPINMLQQHQLEKRGNVWKCGLYGSALHVCSLTRITPSNFGLPYRFQIMHEALQSKGHNHCKNTTCTDLCVLGSDGPSCLCKNGDKEDADKPCPAFFGPRSNDFGEDASGLPNVAIITPDGDNSNTKWVNNLLVLLVVTAVVLAFIYYYKLRSLGHHLRVLFDRKTSADHSIHFVNTTYGLSDGVDSHTESAYHHTRLNPGEHHYENALNIEVNKKTGSNDMNIKGWPNSMGFVEDNGSETSSIEYSDIYLENHKAPLL